METVYLTGFFFCGDDPVQGKPRRGEEAAVLVHRDFGVPQIKRIARILMRKNGLNNKVLALLCFEQTNSAACPFVCKSHLFQGTEAYFPVCEGPRNGVARRSMKAGWVAQDS